MKLKEFPSSENMQQCPCCDYFSLASRGYSLVCPVCFWEDDCEDYENPNMDEVSDVNHGLTLKEARESFKNIGACSPQFTDVVIDDKERESLKYERRSI